MDDNYGKKHEEEVLRAFEKMKRDFKENSPAAQADPPGGFTAAQADTAESMRIEKDEMSSTERSARSRSSKARPKKDKKKRKGRIFWKIILGLFLTFMIVAIAAASVVFVKVRDIIRGVPEINPDNLYDLLSENSVVLDSKGNVLDNIYRGDSLRTNLAYDEIPQVLIDAFIAIEDKTFKEHKGFNYVRIVGAVVDSLKSGERIGGTSTITQQLARNLYLPDKKSQRTIDRKIIEAYYTVILERNLSKEQIIEAYLNTIYLGFNSNGIQAAAQAYFGKDAKDLGLIESACLAALPKSPNKLAPLKRIETSNIVNPGLLDIVTQDAEYTTYYNSTCESRLALVLRLMHEQGKISDAQYKAADAKTLRRYINPGSGIHVATSDRSYFTDYVVSQVRKDLIAAGYDDKAADDLIYSGGLKINTTLNPDIQNILEEVYRNPENFPSPGAYKKDKNGNIISDTGRILLYSSEYMFDEDGSFKLNKDEFSFAADGSLTIFGGGRLNFFRTVFNEKEDMNIEFKPLYEIVEGFLYTRESGVWKIDAKYKRKTEDGDLIISAAFFKDHPEVLVKSEDGGLILGKDYYVLKQAVIQPQSSTVLIENGTGHVVAMIGGREIEGKLLYNRAISPRQPGSAIKPLTIYAPALQAGLDGRGPWTAASPLDDRPINVGPLGAIDLAGEEEKGKPWPKNWYDGYKGIVNMRKAVELSINCCAVQLFTEMDPQWCVDAIQNMGVTSLVTSGPVNDVNASALALGGMTKGISPLEMTVAYETIANYGLYTEPSVYTTVTNKRGDIILRKDPITRRVFDESVASLMGDILRTSVTNGLATSAKLVSQPSAGKTGTTSERYDLWFCGYTPQHSGSTWIGNDVNISLDRGSGAAAKIWAAVMEQVGAMYERQEFEMRGEFETATVDRYSGKLMGELSKMDQRAVALTEKFIKGTVPTEEDDAHVMVHVCAESGYLATPFCPITFDKLAIIRPGGSSWEKLLVLYKFKDLKIDSEPDAIHDAPEYYCPLHNPSPDVYEVSPLYETEEGFSYGETIGGETIPTEPDPGSEPGEDEPEIYDPGEFNPYDPSTWGTDPQDPNW